MDYKGGVSRNMEESEVNVEEYGCDMEHCRGDCDHCFDREECFEKTHKQETLRILKLKLKEVTARYEFKKEN